TTGLIASNSISKGDVLSVARVAGIQAAKQTPNLIPLCHPLLVGSVFVNFIIGDDCVEVEAQVETVDRTGVEMEAMTACSVAALTVYDMCKSVDRSLLILAVVWAVVLVPPWLRSRADARPADSIGAFRHRLTVLERTGPVGTRRVPMLSHRPETHGFVPIARRPAPRGTQMAAMSSRA